MSFKSVMYFFFFSSRRRHTRSDRDWSSDVCSSDLPHDDQRHDEDRLAADPVAEVATDDAADRTGGEPDAERGEGGQGAGDRVRVREEGGPEVEGRSGAEPDEVVRLD